MGDRKRQRQLLGYLLGALDDRQRQRIDEQLANHPGLEVELARVEESLQPLRRLTRVYQPRPGLAARTCRRVFAYADAVAARKSDPRPPRRPVRKPVRAMSPAAVPPSSAVTWGWSDLFVAVGVFLAAAGLIFPAIQSSRMNMRLLTCQNNLRQIGTTQALFQQTRPVVFDTGIFAPDVPMPVSHASLPGEGTSARLASLNAETAAPRVMPASLTGLNRASTFPHQGFSQKVHGQNLLFLDGHATFFTMAPIVDLSDDTAPDEPAIAPWPTDGALPVPNSRALTPIVLVSRQGP